MHLSETFSAEEVALLSRHVTNLNLPVFALTNLPEAVKGALFARYSRSHKSLRRLLLDEFADALDTSEAGAGAGGEAAAGSSRADAFYDRVLVGYGDDSVAQLGGAHVACEQSSNLLTKVLERGRLMSYLEQSTRYLPYDERLSGRYRYHRPGSVAGTKLSARYVAGMDALFDAYSETSRRAAEWLSANLDADPGAAAAASAGDDGAVRRAVRAKALDAARGMLPAASLSNVGIFGSGQAFEALLMRMAASPLAEARDCGKLMLVELRKVIPAFVRRVDQPHRGEAWSRYLKHNRVAVQVFTDRLVRPDDDDVVVGDGNAGGAHVTLLDWDPRGEDKMLAAMLMPYLDVSERAAAETVAAMSPRDRDDLAAAYVGDRSNRRLRPGRALERVDYRFEIVGDYGSFRDLQRHRMLTVEWQPLTASLGYRTPDLIVAAGLGDAYDASMARSADLCDMLRDAVGPTEAGYAVAMGYRIRYVMQFNAREAMHIIELRSQPQGHDAYRRIVTEMHRQIAETAGHHTIAGMLTHADTSTAALGRLNAELTHSQPDAA